MAGTDSMAPRIQGVVWVITAMALITANVRFYIKWKYRGKLWYDDYILVAAVIFLLANVGLFQKTVSLGYGNHFADIIDDNPLNIRTIVMYLQILSALIRLSTTSARISFATTLLQLVNYYEKRFVWFSIITLAAVAMPAVIFPFVSCIPYEKIFDPSIPGTCTGDAVSLGYFIFEAAYTSFIDFALVVLPWRVLSRIQLRRVEKLGASLAMSLGILSGVVTIVKATYTEQIRDDDFTYSSADLTIWNVVEPASIIMAASIPNLRVFVLKNSRHLKPGLKIGSSSGLDIRGRSRKTDELSLENVHNAMGMISAGTDRRRGDGRTWVTSRDGDSAKSNYYASRALPRLAIMQTSTFAVEYLEEPSPTLSPLKDR
ncbi:hypothetical protein F5B22DRAFT_645832 [Xylaria bambusicola]|uniref:uncharacterized protein n=1 Tax=Xylaria bambusicola TaxID=326684 RepID=UPI002008EB46|nr:uncharacterized protein F5B22DRAFT_645832 [Xylaria bambusicola]KAI0517650.1 hypothetical protein F5B22DRAFT_645832 [Xylaria bambusicola]